MDIRNWEYFLDNGLPVVGATVKARDAVLTHPNTGSVLATTSTDSNGMWAFVGLTDLPKDVEVIWGASNQYHRWYKGMVKTGVSALFFEGQTGLLSSGGWTNAPTVTGALGANAINVATTGAAAGEVKTNSHAKIGGTVFPSGQTSLGYRASFGAIAGGAFVSIGVNVVGLLLIFDSTSGANAAMWCQVGGGISTHISNTNTTVIDNTGTDAGTTLSVFRDGATGDYRVKNRTGSSRNVGYQLFGG